MKINQLFIYYVSGLINYLATCTTPFRRGIRVHCVWGFGWVGRLAVWGFGGFGGFPSPPFAFPLIPAPPPQKGHIRNTFLDQEKHCFLIYVCGTKIRKIDKRSSNLGFEDTITCRKLQGRQWKHRRPAKPSKSISF